MVLMGMGGPFIIMITYQPLKMIMSGEGIALLKRHLLSTAGFCRKLPDVARLGVNLAISLHAVRDGKLRDVLVPINRKYKLASLLDTVRHYPGLSNARRVTWEYVMLKAGVNDEEEQMPDAGKDDGGIPSRINLPLILGRVQIGLLGR